MSPRNAAILRWSLLALAGLIAAVAVGVAAAALTSSRIGLSSEPIRAGEALAPKPARPDGRRGGRGRDHPEDRSHRGGGGSNRSTTSTTTVPTTTVPPAPPPATTVPPATTTPQTTQQTTTSDDSGHSEGGDD